MNLTTEQISAQLRCPHGDAAAFVAQNMNLRNLAQISGCLNTLKPQAGEKLLELGYGDGGLLGYVLAQAENLHYTGVEISTAMHQAADEFNRPFIDAKLAEYVLYDGFMLPFADAHFQAAFSVNTLYFWQDPVSLFAEFSRVLQTGGRLCLSFCERNFMQKLPFTAFGFDLYDADEVISLAAPAFCLMNENRLHDWAVSKNGTLLQRETVHLLFENVRAA